MSADGKWSFLVPVALAAANLLASADCAVARDRPSAETPQAAAASGAEPDQLVIKPSGISSQAPRVAQHQSHSSHGSHRSHRSHYSSR